jgi:hypothetical protein
MKKIKTLIIISFLIISVAKAQYFAGGIMGYNSFGYNYDNTKTTDYPKYTVSPIFGYQYNANLSLGALLMYSANNSIERNLEADTKTKDKFTHYALGGFARYTLLSLNKFRIHAQGDLTVGAGGYKTITNGDKEKGKSITTLRLSIKPFLTYSISEHFIIEASLNMLDFGILLLNTKPAKESADSEVVKHHHFYWAESGCGHLPYNSLVSLGLTYNFGSKKVN